MQTLAQRLRHLRNRLRYLRRQLRERPSDTLRSAVENTKINLHIVRDNEDRKDV